jgi:DNA-directed RNA polymerase subunit RPC12/RpoP
MPVTQAEPLRFNDGRSVMAVSDCESPYLTSECLRCGQTMFLPEWSGYLDRHRVQHLWECEACGYKFKTLVSFSDA